MVRNTLLIALIFTSLSCLGCLRYVPSRTEIAGGSSAQTGGAEDFSLYHQQIRAGKEKFVAERASATANATSPTYQLGGSDVIDVQVFGFPNLSGSARVRPSGVVSLPLLNEVEVSGLSEGEVESKIAERLKSYIRNPRVKVSIAEYLSNRASVTGAVVKPGAYPLRRSDYSVLDLISEAGGRTEKAGSRIILVPAAPNGAGSSETAAANSGGVEFSLQDFYGDVSRAPLSVRLLPGDTVIVPDAGTFEVLGDVKNPGAFPLSSSTSVMGAIATAGGLQYSADVSRVELIRKVGEGRQAVLSFDLEKAAVEKGEDFALRDGDVVRVPSARGRFVGRQLVDFLNGVVHVGLTSY